jgi:hypothetical protein
MQKEEAYHQGNHQRIDLQEQRRQNRVPFPREAADGLGILVA